MKLNWFSPLPPAKTGISEYTVKALPGLARRAEIVLWTDQEEWDPSLCAHAEVRPYRLPQVRWPEVNRADLSIYHIGNNVSYHHGIWRLSRQHPGLVILHDLSLQHFFGAVYRPAERCGEYLDSMTRYYGPAGRRAAEKFLGGSLPTEFMAEHVPLTELGVENSLGVLVHNREALADRSRWKCPIAYAPLPFPAGPRAPQARAEVLHKYWAGPPYRVVVFGYIGVNRRLEPLLRALADLPGRERLRLAVYGELWDKRHVQGLVHSLRLGELVSLHGFVPEAELDAALAAAHLAVNLRYPTVGETSYCQLRIWNHALPSLVSRVGWYASIPEGAAAFVRVDREIEDLQAHLAAFLGEPSRFAEIGLTGRRLLEEEHTPEAYAMALVEFAAEVLRFRACSLAHGLAERAIGAMDGWADARTAEAGVEKVAEEIMGIVGPGEAARLERRVPSRAA